MKEGEEAVLLVMPCAGLQATALHAFRSLSTRHLIHWESSRFVAAS